MTCFVGCLRSFRVIFQHADVSSPSRKPLFPGDVVTHMDGTKLDSLVSEQVTQILSAGKKELTLTVIPLSPMRKGKIAISKLHETAMTDSKVPSKSTAADIDAP